MVAVVGPGRDASAGELASAHGITGWPLLAAEEAAQRCFRDWLAERGGVGSGEVADARARLRRAIEVDGHSRFLPWRPDNRTVIRTNALGYVRRASEAVEGEGDNPVSVAEVTVPGLQVRRVARLPLSTATAARDPTCWKPASAPASRSRPAGA